MFINKTKRLGYSRNLFLILILLFQFGFIGNSFSQQKDQDNDHLNGTELLSLNEIQSLPARILEGTKDFFIQETASFSKERNKYWNYNYESKEAFKRISFK